MSIKMTKVKVANAFRAMKAIGISEDKVKPVLKNLLKLFDKNWAYIEAENYRALADAVFMTAEEEVVKPTKNKNVDSTEAADQPKKIVHNDSKDYLDEEELQAAEEELGVPKMPLIMGKEAQAAHHSKKIVNYENKDYLDEEAQAAEEELYQPLKRSRRKYQDGQGSSLNAPECSAPKMPLITPNEAQAADHSKKTVNNGNKDYLDKKAQAAEEDLYQPLKRSRRKHQDGQGSSLNAPEGSAPEMPLITPKEEPNELPETRLPNPSDCKRKCVQSISPESSISSERCDLETEPNIEYFDTLTPKRKSVDANARHESKDGPITDDMSLLAVSNAVIHSDHGGNSPCGSGTVADLEHSVSLSVNENDMTDGTATNEPSTKAEVAMVTDQDSTLEIASLPFTEGNISLSYDLALGRPDFHIPSCGAVLRLLEEKSLRSYKISDPSFSVMNLMKDMCRGYLELGSDSCSEPAEALNMTRAFDSLNKLSATDSCVGGSHLKEMNGGDEHPETNLEKEENCAEDMNLSSMVYEQRDATPEMIKSMQGDFDTANGQENVVITLVNEVNDDRPPLFHYLPKNAIFRNAHMNFTLARIGKKSCCPSCSGDCLSSSEPCTCASESGGDFAYTPGGLVKEDFLEECISMNRDPKEHGQFFCKECPQERAKDSDIIEPCKGHTMRKFIKECWWKCGCDIQCGNRVVQRGISCNLQVFMTAEGKGWGLRTLVDLPKGAFVCEYVGEILTNSELYDRVLRCPKDKKDSYHVILDAGWGVEGVPKDEKALCLDAAYYGNVGRFVNHRCYDSNLVEIPVQVETPDHHYYHLAFFTTRKVNAMEELTRDYGIDFDNHDHPFKAFHCLCGSMFCRNMKRLSKIS